MQGFDPIKVRAHRRQQAEAGFPLLRGCADTFVIGLLLFLDKLSAADRIAFADQLSDFLDTERTDTGMTLEGRNDLLRSFPLVDAYFGGILGTREPVPRARDVRLLPVKVLAGVMKDAQVGGLDGWFKLVGLPDDPAARLPAAAHVASLDEAVPVAPRRLRKLIGDAMKQRFAAQDHRIATDATQYVGAIPGGTIKVDLIFARGSGSTQQFSYHIGATVTGRPPVWMGSYEGLWRVPSRWDLVTETNADRSIAHLVRVIEACLEMV